MAGESSVSYEGYVFGSGVLYETAYMGCCGKKSGYPPKCLVVLKIVSETAK